MLSLKRDNVENKPASLLVMHWKKLLTGFPHLGVKDS